MTLTKLIIFNHRNCHCQGELFESFLMSFVFPLQIPGRETMEVKKQGGIPRRVTLTALTDFGYSTSAKI